MLFYKCLIAGLFLFASLNLTSQADTSYASVFINGIQLVDLSEITIEVLQRGQEIGRLDGGGEYVLYEDVDSDKTVDLEYTISGKQYSFKLLSSNILGSRIDFYIYHQPLKSLGDELDTRISPKVQCLYFYELTANLSQEELYAAAKEGRMYSILRSKIIKEKNAADVSNPPNE